MSRAFHLIVVDTSALIAVLSSDLTLIASRRDDREIRHEQGCDWRRGCGLWFVPCVASMDGQTVPASRRFVPTGLAGMGEGAILGGRAAA
jgi:hypothetical protein